MSEQQIDVTMYGDLGDEQVAAVTSVSPVEMSIATVDTVMMLLSSKEECVVLQSIRTLERFGSANKNNLNTLSRLGIFDKMLPLINCTHLATRRFFYKLLVQLLELTKTRENILRNPNSILKVFQDLAEDADDLIQEYTSKILSELLSQPSVVDLLHGNTNYVEVLFQKLAITDPDTKVNCLECLLHVLKTRTGNDAVTSWPAFSFTPLAALLASRYEKIQRLTLVIFELMTRQKSDIALQTKFRASGAVEQLGDILLKLPWHDLDRKVLCTLANIADTEEGAQMLDRVEVVDDMLTYMDSICRVENVDCCFRIFMNLSKSEVGRNIIVKRNAIKVFLQYLDYDNPCIVESALQALNNMCANTYARKTIRLYEPSPLMTLENFLTKSNNLSEQSAPMTWTMTTLAAETLHTLAASHFNVCQQMANFRMQEVFYDMIWAAEVPPAAINAIVHILEVMAGEEQLCSLVAEREAICCLLNVIQGTKKSYAPHSVVEEVDLEITLSALNAICLLMAEPPTLGWFLEQNGMEVLHACLKNPTTLIREAGGKLVEIMAPSEYMARRFAAEGFVETLLSQVAMRIMFPNWENAIRLIFGYNLPAKWFYLGRLGRLDLTRDKFYTSLHLEKEFQQLEVMLQKKVSPIRPIYMCHFNFNEDDYGNKISCNMSAGTQLDRRVSPFNFYCKSRSRPEVSQLPCISQNIAPGVNEKPSTPPMSTQISSNKRNSTASKQEKSPNTSILDLNRRGSNKSRDRLSGRLRSKSGKVGRKSKTSFKPETSSLDSNASIATQKSMSIYGEPDKYLCHYLQELRLQLIATDKRFAGPTDPEDTFLSIKRAQIVAVFVATQMVGTDPSGFEGRVQELHLNEIKRKLSTNVIPLGHVRFGLHFERALLYKILSDRVHNPCELVRGEHRMAWIELYVSELRDTLTDGVPHSAAASQGHGKEAAGIHTSGDGDQTNMIPNCIVDLMDNIGALMRINSHQAKLYCHKR